MKTFTLLLALLISWVTNAATSELAIVRPNTNMISFLQVGPPAVKTPLTTNSLSDDAGKAAARSALELGEFTTNNTAAGIRAAAGLNDLVSVTYYGAVGDGVTDDTVAIKAALAAVPATGGNIYFPSGTYVLTNRLSVASNTQISGDGSDKTTIKCAAGFTDSSLFLFGGKTNIQISDVTIDLGGNANVTYGLLVNSATSKLKIRRCRITNTTKAGSACIVLTGGASHVDVEDCELDTAPRGISVYSGATYTGVSSYINVNRCRFHDLKDYGVYIVGEATGVTTDCNITGNFLWNINGGTPRQPICVVGDNYTPARRINIVNNHVTGNYGKAYGVTGGAAGDSGTADLIGAYHLAESSITGNTAIYSGDLGIGMYYSSDLSVVGNICTSNNTHGISGVYSTNITINANTCMDNGCDWLGEVNRALSPRSGISFQTSYANIQIDGNQCYNTVSTNQDYGVTDQMTSDGSLITWGMNRFSGNTMGDVWHGVGGFRANGTNLVLQALGGASLNEVVGQEIDPIQQLAIIPKATKGVWLKRWAYDMPTFNTTAPPVTNQAARYYVALGTPVPDEYACYVYGRYGGMSTWHLLTLGLMHPVTMVSTNKVGTWSSTMQTWSTTGLGPLPYSTTAGNTFTFTVAGSRIALNCTFTTIMGYASVTIDGSATAANRLPKALIGTGDGSATLLSSGGVLVNVGDAYLDEYSTITKDSKWLLIADGLSSGNHAVVITVCGARPSGSSANRVGFYGAGGVVADSDPTTTEWCLSEQLGYGDSDAALGMSAFESVLQVSTTGAHTSDCTGLWLTDLHADHAANGSLAEHSSEQTNTSSFTIMGDGVVLTPATNSCVKYGVVQLNALVYEQEIMHGDTNTTVLARKEIETKFDGTSQGWAQCKIKTRHVWLAPTTISTYYLGMLPLYHYYDLSNDNPVTINTTNLVARTLAACPSDGSYVNAYIPSRNSSAIIAGKFTATMYLRDSFGAAKWMAAPAVNGRYFAMFGSGTMAKIYCSGLVGNPTDTVVGDVWESELWYSVGRNPSLGLIYQNSY